MSWMKKLKKNWRRMRHWFVNGINNEIKRMKILNGMKRLEWILWNYWWNAAQPIKLFISASRQWAEMENLSWVSWGGLIGFVVFLFCGLMAAARRNAPQWKENKQTKPIKFTSTKTFHNEWIDCNEMKAGSGMKLIY